MNNNNTEYIDPRTLNVGDCFMLENRRIKLEDEVTISLYYKTEDITRSGKYRNYILSHPFIFNKYYFKIIAKLPDSNYISAECYNIDTNERLFADCYISQVEISWEALSFKAYSIFEVPKDLVIEDYDSLLAL